MHDVALAARAGEEVIDFQTAEEAARFAKIAAIGFGRENVRVLPGNEVSIFMGKD